MNAAAYFEELEASRSDALLRLRSLIFSVFPDISENMDYKMPTYSNEGVRICAIASQKNYMSLYIMNHDLLTHFSEELKTFNCGKSCIRFKELTNETELLFKSILEFIKEHISDSEFYKK